MEEINKNNSEEQKPENTEKQKPENTEKQKSENTEKQKTENGEAKPPKTPLDTSLDGAHKEFLNALPDYDHCLVNLAASVLNHFGVETSAKPLAMADECLAKDYKNVVVLLLDALGMSILEKHLAPDGFFRSHLAGPYDSVYPPTTVAATTSILSGKYPNEHGWLGWDIYYPEVGKNVTVFQNREQMKEKVGAYPTDSYPDGRKKWAPDSLEKSRPAAPFNVGYTYTPYKNLVEQIKEAGGSAYASMPFLPPFPKRRRQSSSGSAPFAPSPGRNSSMLTGTSPTPPCTGPGQ